MSEDTEHKAVGSTIGGITGGVVGFLFTGTQIGWMVSWTGGGHVDPETIEKPSGVEMRD